jgi:hypothetical protein
MNPRSNMRLVVSQLEAELDKYEPVVWWCRKCNMSFEDEDDKIDHEVEAHYFCRTCDMCVGDQVMI